MSVNSSGHLSEARCALFRTNMSICQVVMFVDMKLRISFRTTWSIRKTEAVPLHSLHLDQYHGKSGNQTWLAGKPLIFSMFFPFETSTYSGVFGVPLHVSVRFPKKGGRMPQSTGIFPDPRSSTWTIRVPWTVPTCRKLVERCGRWHICCRIVLHAYVRGLERRRLYITL